MSEERVVNAQFPLPKNYKRGSLIAGQYRPVDLIALILAGVWVFTLIILYSFVFVWDTVSLVLIVLPPLVVGVLTMKHSMHHNYFELIRTRIKYIKKKKQYFNVTINGKIEKKKMKEKG